MKRFLCLVLSACLLFALLPALAETQIGYVNIESKVYMNASDKAIVAGTASLGTQVRIEEETFSEGVGWYRVIFLANNASGWLRADDVDLVVAKRAITGVSSAASQGGAQAVNEAAYPVLRASGLIDPDTLPGAPEPSQYHLIELGVEDEMIPVIKARLVALGFSSNSNTRKLSRDYQAVIKKFQKANGMAHDGICSPEFQAKLFSAHVLNAKGKEYVPEDDIAITKGTVRPGNGGKGGTISFTVKNRTADKVDAVNFRIKLYSTYGERFLLGDYSDQFTVLDELTAFDMTEERATVGKNASLQISLSMGDAYFAGCMVAITAYHSASGATVRIADDQLHWFAFGKGVEKDYQPRLVTPLTGKEQEAAEAWSLGVGGVYVDEEIAAAYGTRSGYLVTAMEPGSPADRAGLQVGDILLAVGDVRIFGDTSIVRAKSRIAAGEEATLLFYRGGAVLQTSVSRPANDMSI